jgi:hypothetical protein
MGVKKKDYTGRKTGIPGVRKTSPNERSGSYGL